MADSFGGARVLVVGGAGFVGSNLVRALDADGAAQIRIVDNLLSAERTDVLALPTVEFTEGSITDDDILASLGDTFDAAYRGEHYASATTLARKMRFMQKLSEEVDSALAELDT